MKRNMAETMRVNKDRRRFQRQDSHMDKAMALPPEMDGCADARELREFLQIYLSIDDPSSRQRILDEVRDASRESD